jgi:hypothetical protein
MVDYNWSLYTFRFVVLLCHPISISMVITTSEIEKYCILAILSSYMYDILATFFLDIELCDKIYKDKI